MRNGRNKRNERSERNGRNEIFCKIKLLVLSLISNPGLESVYLF